MPPAASSAGPPAQIFVIRHGEKPDSGSGSGRGSGVDANGDKDTHGLLPRGWQRAGALTALFAPAVGPLRTGLRTPNALYAPGYGNQEETRRHRTYQTIEGLSDLLGTPIISPCSEGEEAALAAAVLADAGVVLICWEHRHIPAVGASLPTVPGTYIPAWPEDRFDVIWTFTRSTGASNARYVFSQIPQRLLAGDADTVF